VNAHIVRVAAIAAGQAAILAGHHLRNIQIIPAVFLAGRLNQRIIFRNLSLVSALSVLVAVIGVTDCT
jgi:hypothetical protein